ncbi:MAG: 3-deoxy-7-phosphoheptulonate synthase, partial [Gemmatimonadota bacterium]
MLVVMDHRASQEDVDAVVRTIEEMGYEAEAIPGRQRTAIGVVGNEGYVDEDPFVTLDGVREVIHVSRPYKQVSREWRPEETVIELPNGATVGGEGVTVMAGPCSVESEEQILEAARRVKRAGATVLRGGAFKPRTSPYSFQGLGERGLELLARAREETGLAIVTEALDPSGAELVAEYADIIQIGARNMQNYSLLRASGSVGKPVMLKRGISATVREWLLAAEYLLNEGESRVILCERGVRNFDDHARYLLDLTAVPSAKEETHLPVIADPSHGTGDRDKVPPMARAAVSWPASTDFSADRMYSA